VRVNGKNLSLVIGGVEVACVSSSVVLDNEAADAELVTFADVVNGTDRTWFFTITAWQDFAPGSFWDKLWTTPAFTPMTYLWKPYSNATASSAQPHFSGSVTLDQPPPLGGDAQQTWGFSTRLTCTARPTRVVV
jgi:hypothetical protein